MTIQDKISITNTIILFGTAVIIWIYTRATQRSNEIQEEPLLNLYFKEIHSGGAKMGVLSIKNIGKGPAYNVSFERFKLKDYLYTFYLENRLLETEVEAILKSTTETPEGGTEFSDSSNNIYFLSRLVPKTLTPESLKEDPAFFVVNYTGSNGKIYHSIFALYPDIPVVGDMHMQFIGRGKGKSSIEKAKKIWGETQKITSPFMHQEGTA